MYEYETQGWDWIMTGWEGVDRLLQHGYEKRGWVECVRQTGWKRDEMKVWMRDYGDVGDMEERQGTQGDWRKRKSHKSAGMW